VGESHGASDLKIENADVESKNLPQYISNIYGLAEFGWNKKGI
jgi:hypothetical protein